MQQLNFGRIEGLKICNGEPTFDPAARIIQDIKLGTENGPRPELDHGDFVLRSSVVEMFDYFAGLGDGRIAVIEVRHGLPFRLLVERRQAEFSQRPESLDSRESR
jgi:hypothetical protein